MKVFITLGLLVGLLVTSCSAAGAYYQSCFQANILGTSDIMLVLEANCHTPPMGPPWICSQLDLNLCYGNDKGRIIAKDRGELGKTCDNCQLDGSIFSCDCETGLGGKERSSIDTNELVLNQDGWLKCYGYLGERCLPDPLTS
ncbi:hypothetical protein F5X99DRAFT_408925 [Biscogniauxia marginata]|nr:hypothetical protein F5X99DRAFT_408925 [Biscogniauxia marginata]